MQSWERQMPVELRTRLDFVSNLSILLFAFALRKIGLVRPEHTPGMQALTFTFCLPAIIFLVTWTVELRSELLSVVLISALTNLVWAGLVACFVRRCTPQNRGLYSMATTGGSMSFVFATVLRSERLGAEAAAIVAMWELGGNMAVAVVFHGISASAYAPQVDDDADSTTSSLHRLSSSESVATIRPSKTAASVLPVVSPEQVLPVVIGVPSVDGGGVQARKHSSAERLALALAGGAKLLQPALRNPVMYAMLLGITLNLSGVPVYPLPARAAQSLMGAFPPLLYAFLGANLRFDLGPEGYALVAKVITARLAACAPLALLARFALPLSERMCGVIVLCLAAPIASSFLMYSAQYGYRMDQNVMVFNVSALVALILLTMLEPLV